MVWCWLSMRAAEKQKGKDRNALRAINRELRWSLGNVSSPISPRNQDSVLEASFVRLAIRAQQRIVADMNRVAGIYKEGRVILQNEVDWPQGAKVEVLCESGSECTVAGEICDDTPEGVTQWLAWFDSLTPVFAGEELNAFESRLRETREEQKALHSGWERRLGELLK